ncbi:hypothetical protein ACHAXT_013312 [Thalassiosira profunda]
MAGSRTKTATKVPAKKSKQTKQTTKTKKVTKRGGAPKAKVQWTNVPDQNRMLQHDWKIAKESCHLELLFASNKVELGNYGGCDKVALKDINVGASNAMHTIKNGGCDECWSDEVYTFRMQEAAGGKVRLVVQSWVECCCNDGELDTCEECDYVAHPVAT